MEFTSLYRRYRPGCFADMKGQGHVVAALQNAVKQNSPYMNIVTNVLKKKIKDIVPEMKEWRHQIHEKPEIAYQEKVTSKFIANKLKDFGLEVIEEFGETGVVGIIGYTIESTVSDKYTVWK